MRSPDAAGHKRKSRPTIPRAAAGIVVRVLALLASVLLVVAAISALNDFFT
ncbi:MAG: hypothetical protein OXH86_15840 [Acidimicrobiaceae bacterium]|nr:hypothetical protein [Acidimicrobiaceae bacterium]MDE0498821.1 hypothetical protein [Acidimicrobiaceae bacterium]